MKHILNHVSVSSLFSLCQRKRVISISKFFLIIASNRNFDSKVDIAKLLLSEILQE